MRSIFNFQFSIFSTAQKIAPRFSASELAVSLRTNNYALATNRGYSLVEVLVAITVLLIALVGPLTIAHSGLKRAYNSREQTMAVFLAQEGLEAVAKLREDNAIAAYPDFSLVENTWGDVETVGNRCTPSNPCGVNIGEDGAITSSSFYTCNSTNCAMRYSSTARVPYRQGVASGEATPYERRLIMDVDGARVSVTATVTWGESPSQNISLQSYFYNIYTSEDMPPEGSGAGVPQSVGNVQGPYYSNETGPRAVLRDAMESSCGNCGMTSQSGSPNNNAATRARLCIDMFGAGSTVESYTSGSYTSPGNNYIYSWSGGVWSIQGASAAGNNLVKSITCLTY